MFTSMLTPKLWLLRAHAAPWKWSTHPSRYAHFTKMNMPAQKHLAPKISLSTMRTSSMRNKLKRISHQFRSHTWQRMGESIRTLLSSSSSYYSNFFYRNMSQIALNNSNYEMHPDVFSTFVIPDLTLIKLRSPDGLQECATYNPPGLIMPGNLYPVGIFSVNNLSNISLFI